MIVTAFEPFGDAYAPASTTRKRLALLPDEHFGSSNSLSSHAMRVVTKKQQATESRVPLVPNFRSAFSFAMEKRRSKLRT